MGLDMYLTGEKYLLTDHENPDNNRTEDGFPLKGKLLRLGYWRKHPNLHGFIVNTFADGEDTCHQISLDADDKQLTVLSSLQYPAVSLPDLTQVIKSYFTTLPNL